MTAPLRRIIRPPRARDTVRMHAGPYIRSEIGSALRRAAHYENRASDTEDLELRVDFLRLAQFYRAQARRWAKGTDYGNCKYPQPENGQWS